MYFHLSQLNFSFLILFVLFLFFLNNLCMIRFYAYIEKKTCLSFPHHLVSQVFDKKSSEFSEFQRVKSAVSMWYTDADKSQ